MTPPKFSEKWLSYSLQVIYTGFLWFVCYLAVTAVWEDHALIQNTSRQLQAVTPFLKQLAQVTVHPTTHNLQLLPEEPTTTTTTLPPTAK